jgi:CheY-like chemotaxis protein/nitrogen-specific signal transduction histidine kinase
MQRDRPRTAVSEGDDVTATVPLEQALARAEEGCRARDDLLSVAAHALRTPLTAILGWVTLLQVGELDAATAARAIEVIERNARRQAELIAALIDATRILGRRLGLNRGRVDFCGLVDNAIVTARAAAEARDVRLHAALDPAAAVVWGDPDRLAQIVASLLANAVKYSPAGGRIDVRLARVGGEAELQVRDEGVGIAPAALPHLFDRLPRSPRDVPADRDGARSQLGLSLAIARHLAELHGGALSAVSDGPGRGATFTLRLPLRGSSEEAAGDEPAGDEPAGLDQVNLEGLRVLIVGDEGRARDAVARNLSGRGAAVSTASSSEQAMRDVAGFAPDAMVVDLEMRGEAGYDFIGRVRALGPVEGGRTPAVALSSHSRPEDRLRTLRAGFQIHVAKPAPPRELATVVARLGARLSPPPLPDEDREA